MGLTIHYRLTTSLTAAADVRELVKTIRRVALDLPFQEVGEIREFTGGETDGGGDSDEDLALKVRATAHVLDGPRYLAVPSLHTVAFSAYPGEGCEPADFGLSTYPAFAPSPGRAKAGGEQWPTNLVGWSWRSFCKTQYASDPACGGVANFLRCHLCVIKLLDVLKQSGLVTVEVQDEGKYWQKRDLEALVKEVGAWNELIAGLVGEFRSAAEGKGGDAPIAGFPNFEHLEAKGLERLAELRQRLGRGQEEK